MKSHGRGCRSLCEETEGIDSMLSCVRVDIKDGKIYWTQSKSRRKPNGSEAGTRTNKGYTHIQFDGKMYRRHRIVFYVAHGYLPLIVDHKHGVEAGDGIDNLQEATSVENAQKQNIHTDNISGYKGVSYHKQSGRFFARICINGKTKSLGYFDTPEQASFAYEEKAKQEFGFFYNNKANI